MDSGVKLKTRAAFPFGVTADVRDGGDFGLVNSSTVKTLISGLSHSKTHYVFRSTASWTNWFCTTAMVKLR